MSEEIKKLINESIASVIAEPVTVTETIAEKAEEVGDKLHAGAVATGKGLKKFWKQSQDDMSKGKAAEIVYDKLHPEKEDVNFKLAKGLAKVSKEKRDLENMGVGAHLAKAGKKAVAAGKEKAEDLKDAVKEHPALAAATAAGLAAGVGGLAAVKKMRKAAKKK